MDILYIVYITVSLVFGLIIMLTLHYVGDFPYPWQMKRITRRGSEPDSLALSECFEKLSDNEQIHLIMGNASHFVCEQDIVVDSLREALEKKIKVALIHGPDVDTRSNRFLNLLRENSEKVALYEHPESPSLHFRVILDANGPREVYVEEPHVPFEDHGFRRIQSRRVSRQYEEIFRKALQRSLLLQ